MDRKLTQEELVQLETIEDNYLIIKLDYSNEIVLTYKEGMKFLDVLKTAEKYNGDDYKNPYIQPLYLKLEVRLIGAEDYRKLKILQLLGPRKKSDE